MNVKERVKMKSKYKDMTLEAFVKEVRDCFKGLERQAPERVRKFFDPEDGEGYGICAYHWEEAHTIPEYNREGGATPETWMQGRVDDAFEECNLEI